MICRQQGLFRDTGVRDTGVRDIRGPCDLHLNSMVVGSEEVKSGREPGAEMRVVPAAPGFADMFTGAPLDVVKLVAAILMVVDHVNVIFLAHEANIWWKLGRIVFPLFCFATACN